MASIAESVVAPLTIWTGSVLRSKEVPVSSAQTYYLLGTRSGLEPERDPPIYLSTKKP